MPDPLEIVPPWAAQFGLHPPFPGGSFDLYLDSKSPYFRADIAAHFRAQAMREARREAERREQERREQERLTQARREAEHQRAFAETARRRRAEQTLERVADPSLDISLGELRACWSLYKHLIPGTHVIARGSEINGVVSFRTDRYLYHAPGAGVVDRCDWAGPGDIVDVYVDSFHNDLCVAAPDDRLNNERRDVIAPVETHPTAVPLRRWFRGHRGWRWRITSSATFPYVVAVARSSPGRSTAGSCGKTFRPGES